MTIAFDYASLVEVIPGLRLTAPGQADEAASDAASAIVDAPAGTQNWIAVCPLAALHPERGVAAILDGSQLALFRLGDTEVYAVQQTDPYSGSQVMSRGLVGTRGDKVTVASPMFKQVFDLATGECLDTVGKEERTLTTYPVRIDEAGTVFVDMGPAEEGAADEGAAQ